MIHPEPTAEETRIGRDARRQAIETFVRTHFPAGAQDIYAEMMVTMFRLAADHCSRGELKILNRALKELRYAFKVFSPWRHVYKVSIFGSARTREDHPQYQQALKFAELIQRAGWMVITGAGDGIMRAGHHGATRESSFGVAISLPFEQSTNTIIADDDKLVKFKYFFTRKLMFVKEAHAVVLFPGGFGTQDEGFEVLTLVQTGKAHPMPIILVDEPGGTYWPHWRRYVEKELLGAGMISPEDMNLFFMTDSAEEAVAHAIQFYRRYHSSRFVGHQLVIRMKTPLPEEVVEGFNRDFSDILSEGRIVQQSGPLPMEHGEAPELPRLVFAYHKRSAGRLRLMINAMNEAP